MVHSHKYGSILVIVLVRKKFSNVHILFPCLGRRQLIAVFRFKGLLVGFILKPVFTIIIDHNIRFPGKAVQFTIYLHNLYLRGNKIVKIQIWVSDGRIVDIIVQRFNPTILNKLILTCHSHGVILGSARGKIDRQLFTEIVHGDGNHFHLAACQFSEAIPLSQHRIAQFTLCGINRDGFARKIIGGIRRNSFGDLYGRRC